MPRMKSEMLEEYAKLADKIGLTKMAEDSAELKKYKDDVDARMGSDDISTIEALYGVKPEGQDYDWNIMEQAHPNSVIIAPSYDKLNGLVENNIEQHNIMSNIALKPNTGNHTNPKYAAKELMFELVRVANEMDARNNDELRKLADNCIEGLSQSQVKTALAPLAFLGIASAVLAAGWLASHTDNVSNGPLADADNAIKTLDNLRTNSWYESNVDKTVQNEASNLITHIAHLKDIIIKFNGVNDMIYKPRTLSDLKELVSLNDSAKEHGSEIIELTKEFKSELLELEPLLAQAIDNFSSTAYQKDHTAPSTVSKMTGWLGEALHGRWGLVANDFVSAINALNPLKNSLEELSKRMDNLDKVNDKYKQDIQTAMSKVAPKEQSSMQQVSDKDDSGNSSTHEDGFLKNLMEGVWPF